MKTQIFEHDAYGKKLVRIVRIDYDRSVLFFDDDTYLTTETRESPPLTLVQLSDLGILNSEEIVARKKEKEKQKKKLCFMIREFLHRYPEISLAGLIEEVEE